MATFASLAATPAADDDISLSMVPSALLQKQLMVSSTWKLNGNKNGAQRNLYRVRQIEGVCEKDHKGTVREAFWIGNCAG